LRTAGEHSPETVEWQSVAHIEGLADFFAEIAFNNYSSGADCWLPKYIPSPAVTMGTRNCESVGKALERCAEWTNSTLFGKTGNTADWGKMYWDYFADRGGSISAYMAAEAAVISWPTQGNHFDLFYAKLNATQKAKLSAAAGGNIWDGPAQ
jgi:hypothetical protein